MPFTVALGCVQQLNGVPWGRRCPGLLTRLLPLLPPGLMGLQGPTVPGGPFTRHESKGAAASSITPCNAGLPSGPQGESFQAALADLEAQVSGPYPTITMEDSMHACNNAPP